MSPTDLLRRASLHRLSDYTPPDADTRLRFSLKRLLLEGMPSDIVLRIMGTFITPFALALKATIPQIGFLTALPYLAGAIAQLFTHNLVSRAGSRRRFTLIVLLLGALVWIPIALLPWIVGGARVWWLLGLVTLAVTLFQMPLPAWGSWVSQLLPANRRGRFVGARATLASLIGIVTVLALGRWLDMMESHVFIGFSLVFFGVVLCRFLSFLLFTRVHEPPLPKGTPSHMGLRKSMARLAGSNLGRFLVLTSLFHFSLFIAGPFFAVLMLRDLGFSYTTFISLQVVSVVAMMAGMQFWGRFADRWGNARVLHLAAPLLGLGCLGWLFNQSLPFLALVQVVMGFAAAGYILSSPNYVGEASTDEERTRNVGYFGAMNGIGISLGSVVGGFLAPILPQLFAHGLLTLILISGVLRIVVGLLIMVFIREVREGVETPKPVRLPHLHLAPVHIRSFSLRRR